MNIQAASASVSNVTAAYASAVARQTNTVAPSAASPYSPDRFVPSGYVPNPQGQNILYGQGKNVGIRLIDKSLGLKSSYIESAFIDKTPQDAMHIEEVDFNLHVKAAEVSVSDVDATLTVETILRRKQMASGKASPINDLRISFDPNNQIKATGKVKVMGFNVPFQVNGTIAADTAGQIRYDLGKAKVAGVGVNGLMKVFGMNLEKLLKLNNPAEGYYAKGNSLLVNLGQTISQLDGAPGIHAEVRGVTTHLGKLQILVGDTPEDAQRVIAQKNLKEPNYLRAQGDHAYVDGFFLKNGQVSIYDATPGSPLNINYKGPGERNIQLHSGHVGVAGARFQELISDEIGESDILQDIGTNLKDGYAKVSTKLFGFIPLAINMKFQPTADGRLMFEAQKTTALGFIPIPKGLVRSKLQKAIKGGEPYGNGVALGQLNGIDLGKIKAVDHQQGYLVITTGQPTPYNYGSQN